MPDAPTRLTCRWRPGVTRDQLALGDRIFHGAAENGTCGGCHGSDAKGTPEGPNLTGTKIWSDGSPRWSGKRRSRRACRSPRNYPGAMPAKGGASLTDADVTAVAAYVWALGHHTK